MSARFQRRTFAAPFVVTLAGCMVQSAPPPREPRAYPQPQPSPQPAPQPTVMSNPPRPGVEQSQPTPPPTVISNPPRPGAEQSPPAPTAGESHWTVMKQGNRCVAYVKTSCPAGAMCNPPPPTDYACTADITPKTPLKIVRWAGQATCVVEPEPMSCPPQATCNPPRPRQVSCPQ
jgi:hypothetical protein